MIQSNGAMEKEMTDTCGCYRVKVADKMQTGMSSLKVIMAAIFFNFGQDL